MPSYAIGMLSQIKTDHDKNEINVKHVAYADDLGGARKMLKWWNNIVNFGPLIGYYPKASKSWLVIKQQQFETAKHVFKDTNINITTEGRKYLGGFFGTKNAQVMNAYKRRNKCMEDTARNADRNRKNRTSSSLYSICNWL